MHNGVLQRPAMCGSRGKEVQKVHMMLNNDECGYLQIKRDMQIYEGLQNELK